MQGADCQKSSETGVSFQHPVEVDSREKDMVEERISSREDRRVSDQNVPCKNEFYSQHAVLVVAKDIGRQNALSKVGPEVLPILEPAPKAPCQRPL